MNMIGDEFALSVGGEGRCCVVYRAHTWCIYTYNIYIYLYILFVVGVSLCRRLSSGISSQEFLRSQPSLVYTF